MLSLKRVCHGGGADDYHDISTTWFGRALRDNQIKGLTIDQPGGRASYGQTHWSTVRLAITHKK
jgi:hypothetical protein